MDKRYLNEIPYEVLQFVKSLKKKKIMSFIHFKKIEIFMMQTKSWFSCYALKIYYMTLEHKNLSKGINSWLLHKSFILLTIWTSSLWTRFI